LKKLKKILLALLLKIAESLPPKVYYGKIHYGKIHSADFENNTLTILLPVNFWEHSGIGPGEIMFASDGIKRR
jgi:hypothetical protein